MADDDRTALFDGIERDLAGVELALARLDAGAYFTCDTCRCALDPASLADDPTLTRCAPCGTGGTAPIDDTMHDHTADDAAPAAG